MSVILNLVGWPVALVILAAVAAAFYRLVKRKNYGSRGVWILPVLALLAAAAVFTLLGVLPAIAGWGLTGILAVVLVLLPWKKGYGTGYALDRARNDSIHLREDMRAGGGWLIRLLRRLWARGDQEDEETPAVVAEHVTTRNIPPVRMDPALGPMPEPAVISSVQAPMPFLELAKYVAQFEPEDDQALTMFMQGCASGGMVLAEAWRHFADVCLGSVGLDPAYVAGILEVGDTEGESAAHKAQVHKRFGVIYQTVQEWIAGGRMLPHRARDFLTGEGA